MSSAIRRSGHRVLIALAAGFVIAGASMLARQAGGGARTVTPPAVAPAPQNQPGTAAISGVVTDTDTRRPIPGVVVFLGPAQSGSNRITRQTTDARGRFVFDQLPPSNAYYLTATKPGYLDTRYGQLPGMTSGARIALADAQWIPDANIEMSKVGAIGGVITDEMGEPVVGAFVKVFVEVPAGRNRSFASSLVVKTNDRGEYRVAGLFAGKYLVAVPSVQNTVPGSATPAQVEGLRPDMMARLDDAIAQGRTVARVNNGAISSGNARLIVGNYTTSPPLSGGAPRAYPSTFYPGTTDLATAIPIDLAAGTDRSGINIALAPLPAVRVSGRVEGQATQRLTLRLIPTGHEALGKNEAATTILDADGTFTFLNVPSGSYTLDASQSTFELIARPLGGGTSNASVPPTPGRELLGREVQHPINSGPLSVYLAARLPPDTPGPSFFGRTVVNVGAANVSDVVLRLERTGAIRGRIAYEDVKQPPRQPAITAAAIGAPASGGLFTSENEIDISSLDFEIHGLVPGTYRLFATTRPTTLVKSITVGGQDMSKRPMEITAGQDIADVIVTFTDKVASLSGIARPDPNTAMPAAVVLFTTDPLLWPDLTLQMQWAASASTNSDGAFRFPALAAGDYFVAAIDASRLATWTDPEYLKRLAVVASRVSLTWGEASTIDVRRVVVK